MNASCARFATIVVARNLRQRAVLSDKSIYRAPVRAINSTLDLMSNVSSSMVWVIVDPEFGEGLGELPKGEAVWVMASSTNSAVVTRLWTERVRETHLTGITTFKADSSSTPEELVTGLLETIDLHHGQYSSKPPYSKIRVIGANMTPIIEEAFSEFGFVNFVPMPNGFVAEKL